MTPSKSTPCNKENVNPPQFKRIRRHSIKGSNVRLITGQFIKTNVPRSYLVGYPKGHPHHWLKRRQEDWAKGVFTNPNQNFSAKDERKMRALYGKSRNKLN